MTAVPADTPAEEVLAMKPDGVFLSNGPGDPEPIVYAQQNIRELLGKTPIFGICLGHQLLSLALGGKTYKLKFGHRGANHPVRDEATGKVHITAQNHGYAVDGAGLAADVTVSQLHLNDGTIEGLQHRAEPVFTIQYHSEASPGPNDTEFLFDRFLATVVSERRRRPAHQ